jgi:hypothetical protein
MIYVRLLAVVLVALGAAACGDEEDEPAPKAASQLAGGLVPMSESGFRVEWGRPGVPSPVEPGAQFAVGVAVTNRGDQVWADPRTSDQGAYASGAVRLAYRWWGADPNKPFKDYGPERGDLLAPVNPGQTALLVVAVTAPSEPGSYRLQLELVQENVAWFQGMGASQLMVPVQVAVAATAARPKP